MPVYSGAVTEVGPGTLTRFEVRRTFIDIGGHHLVSVGSSQYIDAYLTKAAGQGGETSLSLWSYPPYGTSIVAIKLPDGQRRSISDEPGIVGAYRRQMIMVGVAVGLFGSFILGLILGNIGVLAALAVAFGYPIMGTKSLREARQAV